MKEEGGLLKHTVQRALLILSNLTSKLIENIEKKLRHLTVFHLDSQL